MSEHKHTWAFMKNNQVGSHHPTRGHVWWHWVISYFCQECLAKAERVECIHSYDSPCALAGLHIYELGTPANAS